MTATTHPPKQAVRHWLASRQEKRTPPPSPADIRRELGWELLANNQKARP